MGSVEVIYLSRRDGVHSARELLRSATPGGQVWLVIPWRAGWARNRVNLRLLRRVSEGAGIDLRLVSQHLETRTLAREAGVVSHFFVPPALLRYRSQRSRVVPADVPEGERWQARPRQFGVGTALIGFGLVAGLAAILFGSAPCSSPRHHHPGAVAERVAGHIDVRADPRFEEIDYAASTIPARYIQVDVEGTGEVPSTGRVEVPDGVATGEVVFANRTDAAVQIPKGTVVRTSSGTPVSFYTTADAEVPGRLYASTRVGIVAREPGLLGNVKELTINVIEGPLSNSVDVLNDAPTSGGTTKSVPMVSEADLLALPEVTQNAAVRQAYELLIDELEEGEFVPYEAQLPIPMGNPQYLQQVNARSDVASARMRLIVNALAIDSRDVEEFAMRYLETRLDGERQILPSSLELSRSPGVLTQTDNTTPQWFDMTLSAAGLVGPVIDAEALERELTGKSAGQASAWLREHLALRSDPEIEITPKGWPLLPWLSGHIDIQVVAEAG